MGEDNEPAELKNVKKKYREDWFNEENKIFINKLNHICKNYDQTTRDVSCICSLSVSI